MLKHRQRILINSSSSSRNLITWNCKQRKKIKGKPITCPAIDNMEKDQIIYDKRKVIGESIRAMRTAQGLEQEQLAQIAGITAANVRSIEAGKYAVNIDVLNKIAMALGAELRLIEKK